MLTLTYILKSARLGRVFGERRPGYLHQNSTNLEGPNSPDFLGDLEDFEGGGAAELNEGTPSSGITAEISVAMSEVAEKGVYWLSTKQR